MLLQCGFGLVVDRLRQTVRTSDSDSPKVGVDFSTDGVVIVRKQDLVAVQMQVSKSLALGIAQ